MTLMPKLPEKSKPPSKISPRMRHISEPLLSNIDMEDIPGFPILM
jgi:hypothetical protein